MLKNLLFSVFQTKSLEIYALIMSLILEKFQGKIKFVSPTNQVVLISSKKCLNKHISNAKFLTLLFSVKEQVWAHWISSELIQWFILNYLLIQKKTEYFFCILLWFREIQKSLHSWFWNTSESVLEVEIYLKLFRISIDCHWTLGTGK